MEERAGRPVSLPPGGPGTRHRRRPDPCSPNEELRQAQALAWWFTMTYLAAVIGIAVLYRLV
jgi:hypothetical protein